MKRLVLLLASFLFAALALGQETSVISAYRIHPKPGKGPDLKQALSAHAAKFHTGDRRWRVFQVVSGGDEGSYQINEGPTSWTALEARKNISDDHDRDYQATILPLVEKTFPATYLKYQGEFSTDPIAGTFKKVLLRRFYLKPGKNPQFRGTLATWKKAFEKAGRRVTVWTTYFSGQPRFDVAMRLGGGWADIDGFQPNDMQKAYDSVAGAGAFDKFMGELAQYVDRIDEDMLELLPEVGSQEGTSKQD